MMLVMREDSERRGVWGQFSQPFVRLCVACRSRSADSSPSRPPAPGAKDDVDMRDANADRKKQATSKAKVCAAYASQQQQVRWSRRLSSSPTLLTAPAHIALTAQQWHTPRDHAACTDLGHTTSIPPRHHENWPTHTTTTGACRGEHASAANVTHDILERHNETRRGGMPAAGTACKHLVAQQVSPASTQ